ncbi:unnamed protein product [Pleuronectes platessa]|uniref:Uncharacterized protein n=1 Tax=Pleuronectes platessa TaxID=8262 RepID=A0A9N7UA13_PLEPL|nr:unnamed protein product [Pleuronectes platessa]
MVGGGGGGGGAPINRFLNVHQSETVLAQTCLHHQVRWTWSDGVKRDRSSSSPQRREPLTEEIQLKIKTLIHGAGIETCLRPVQQGSLLALNAVSLFTCRWLSLSAPRLTAAERRTMSAVQLLRVSVHERIRAAAEHFLLRLEKGEEPARVPALRAMLTERLTAEIVAVFEETVAEYEDRVERSEREVCRQRRLLDAVMKPEVRLHKAGQSREEPGS